MAAFRWRWLLMAFLLAGVAGCAGEAVTFNNGISKTTKDLEKTGKEFGQSLGQYKNNPAKLKELHTKLIADVTKIIQEAKAMKVPDVAQAKEFHAAFLEYLTAEDKLLKQDFGQLVTLLPQGNMQAIDATLKRIEQVENTYVQKLKAAQASFARAHNFKIR